jgi:hypothetical protein
MTQTILGTIDMGGAKLIHGTFVCAGGSTGGTIDIRGQVGGSAVKVPFRVIGGAICNTGTIADPDLLMSTDGTMAFTTGANDSGTWFMILG